MRVNLAAWFPQIWKRSALRAVGDYQAIASQHPYFLADIALRGHVYTDAPPARDLFEAGVNEGMRRMAIGIINTCQASHGDLRAVIDAAQKGGTP